MTYPESVQFLFDLRLHGLKLGLENTRQLAELAGRPQDRLRFIHVAGTNGKGSTCAMLESIYRAAGLSVGLYTSPHLVSFRERIQVNRVWMSEAEVVESVDRLRRLTEDFPADHQPTFFEVVTVLALMHFVAGRCDLVVWETGMGGRFDATNVVRPLASVITNIELDHERWLGSTRAEIATEKAGIIKPRIPVLTACDDPEALEVIRSAAASAEASLSILPPGDAAQTFLPPNLQIPLDGAHQRRNAALAAATVAQLRDIIPVPPLALRRGLEEVDWPGRMQRVRPRPGVDWVLDGAHNPAGLHALVRGLEEEYPGRRPVFVMGVLKDKDYAVMVGLAAAVAAGMVFVPVRSDRSIAPQELARTCRLSHPSLPANCLGSVREALSRLEAEQFVVVTGSLYLVGEAMDWLGLSPARDTGEQALNDWSALDPQPAAAQP
jgi:dihydrofolate synthase/folylpolyglutamate synthase